MGKQRILTLALLALLVLFGNHIVYQQLEGARLDMTSGNLYSLTGGTQQILERMQNEGVKPIDIELYFSETSGKTLPRFIKGFITYERYLRSLLREYERSAKGKIRLRFVDPMTDSDESQDALDYGLDGKPINQDGDLFFFGLVFQTQTGSRDVIEFLWPDRQETIEYEISKKIHSLLWPSGKTVGVLSSLDVFGSADNPYLAQMLAAQGRQPSEKWISLRLLEESYNVRRLDPDTGHISPDEFDLVVVIHPKNLSGKALWALDEWIVRGGNALIFVDPYALDDRPPQNPQQPWAALQYSPASNLEPLFKAWGLAMPAEGFAADLALAARRSADPRGTSESFVIDLVIDESKRGETLDLGHPILQGLSNLRFLMAGALEAQATSALEFTRLVATTASGSLLTIRPGFGDGESLSFTDLNSPERLKDAYEPGSEAVSLGYQIVGRLPSAFPDGADYPAEAPETPPGFPPGMQMPPAPDAEMIHQDPVPDAERADSTVMVFSDVDLISDQIAFQRNFLGLVLAVNDNSKLLLNAVDYLLGARELMDVRAKHAIQRPFTRFDEIEAEAEKQTLEREKQLRADIEAAQEELRAKRQELSGREAALFQKRAQEEVDRLNESIGEANRELREIRKARREALEKEAARVRFAVMGWMPLMVLAAGIWLTIRRRRRHSQAMGIRGGATA